jgi:hypothetical protein
MRSFVEARQILYSDWSNIHIVIAIFGRSLISPRYAAVSPDRDMPFVVPTTGFSPMHLQQIHTCVNRVSLEYQRSSQQLHASNFPPGRRILVNEKESAKAWKTPYLLRSHHYWFLEQQQKCRLETARQSNDLVAQRPWSLQANTLGSPLSRVTSPSQERQISLLPLASCSASHLSNSAFGTLTS